MWKSKIKNSKSNPWAAVEKVAQEHHHHQGRPLYSLI